MTAPRLATLIACVVGCSASPQDPGEGDAEPGVAAPAEPEAAPESSEARVEPSADPILARARQGVRDGRVADPIRTQLLASTNPDHRHAARLLQVIAGEEPAPLLSRAGTRSPQPGQVPAMPSVQPPPSEPAPPMDEPRVEPEPTAEPAAPPSAPEPDRAAQALEPATEAPAEQAVEPALVAELLHERLAAWSEPSRSLLLHERPPRAQDPSSARSGPQLVILTSLALRPSAEGASLTLMGAGAVELEVLPIDAYHLRLSVVGAGAVPGFLDARPSVPGLEVVSVLRLGRVIEVELEHGAGWVLAGTSRVDNGAVAEFRRVRGSGAEAGP